MSKYYLIVSRLVAYKKVDLAIRTFNKLRKPLLVVGTGRDFEKLKFIARYNIKFAGEVSDKELSDVYKNARALVMPQEEDFGIVSVEAQHYGVPVIAFKKGGALDTVIEGVTGVFFDKQEVPSLTAAIKRFEKIRFVVDNLYTSAKRFSEDNFKTNFLALVRK